MREISNWINWDIQIVFPAYCKVEESPSSCVSEFILQSLWFVNCYFWKKIKQGIQREYNRVAHFFFISKFNLSVSCLEDWSKYCWIKFKTVMTHTIATPCPNQIWSSDFEIEEFQFDGRLSSTVAHSLTFSKVPLLLYQSSHLVEELGTVSYYLI